jgi:hypothetical protein
LAKLVSGDCGNYGRNKLEFNKIKDKQLVCVRALTERRDLMGGIQN